MKKLFLLVCILLAIVLCLLFIVEKNKPVKVVEANKNKQTVQNEKSAEVKITFFDVGQGDAIFIEFPDGEQMLVDCAIDARILAKLGQAMPYYDKDIDYLVITHPDSDHYGGCIDVLDRFQIKNIVYNGLQKENNGFWKEFWQAVQKEGAVYHEIDKEQIWDIASSTIHFYFPDRPAKEIKNMFPRTGDNDTSIVFDLSDNGKKALFTGDAQIDLENYLVKTYGKQLDSDILKVGHHGSGGSSHQEFLDLVSPLYSVISVGKDNDYGHPSLRVLKKLERVGSRIFMTDESGNVVCIVNDELICNSPF